MDTLSTKTILAITGPTCVGKTALSLEIANRIGAEIVSADSRQIYRDLDIGTAKPSVEERGGVPHHFIDTHDPHQSYSAGTFARDAEAVIGDILKRGRTPLVVGGSTLYLSALMNSMAATPPVDAGIRNDLNARLESKGLPPLLAELQAADPIIYKHIDTANPRRVLRALEVYRTSGRPLSSFYKNPHVPTYAYTLMVLYTDRDSLYKDIESRVDRMVSSGLIDEVRGLLANGHEEAPALNTIGYREPQAYLRGDISLDEMVGLLKRNSRRYAKRQLTWFRKDARAVWVSAGASSHDILRSRVINYRS